MNDAAITRSTARSLITLIAALFLPLCLHAYDPGQFYRAGFFNGEPRLACCWLGTVQVDASHGSTNCSRNANSCKTTLLNLHGSENFHLLGKNLPGIDPTNYLDMILTELWMIPSEPPFGKVQYGGKFSLTQVNLTFYQNFNYGLFFEAYLPLEHAQINGICSMDVTPDTCDQFPSRDAFEWQRFIANKEEIFARYEVDTGCVDNKGVGDLQAFLGWAFTTNDTEVIDFIDASFKVGVLISTAKKTNVNKVFDIIPLGYDGHTGGTLQGTAAVGMYEWLTFEGHIGATLFNSIDRQVRMKSDAEQNGFIKLARGTAHVKRGTQWNIGCAAKADHVCRGMSFMLGYTYFQKDRDTVIPVPVTCALNPCVVNNDSCFDGWKMHTLHLALEYDFTRCNACWGWRLGVFYNKPVAGREIFTTGMAGGMIGIDAVIDF